MITGKAIFVLGADLALGAFLAGEPGTEGGSIFPTEIDHGVVGKLTPRKDVLGVSLVVDSSSFPDAEEDVFSVSGAAGDFDRGELHAQGVGKGLFLGGSDLRGRLLLGLLTAYA